ncbi:hypothetical protein [Escherichia fergusonii]|uniref:hypothetical protein n=1 Tax=Escherichia fergusonii TaxID=564 RepID=UPI002016C655|nr:hypothetical protein [Escherichia fergusonii]
MNACKKIITTYKSLKRSEKFNFLVNFNLVLDLELASFFLDLIKDGSCDDDLRIEAVKIIGLYKGDYDDRFIINNLIEIINTDEEGSAASGISKAHDPSISRPIDFNNFDVDAYIKSDFLANDPAFTNRRRDAAEISGMKEIEASIDRKLRAIFPGLRAEPFGFRIFKTHELSDLARHGDTQHNVGCK